ncbi:MAG: hypothetical protein ACRDRZ_05455 [Pseudonocardiaceae bacterium]
MMARPQPVFECRGDLTAPVEVAAGRGGGVVVRLRRDIRVTPGLVAHLNDLFAATDELGEA